MSRHFILDGYNVLHSTDQWVDGTRDKNRQEFLRFLDRPEILGSGRNVLTVVLDGYAASLKGIRLTHIRLAFSGDLDADTFIKSLVSDSNHPGDAVVVTNDRALRTAVRHNGAQIMSCEEFLSKDKKKKPTTSSTKADPHSEQAINNELKRLWRLE